MKEYVTESEFIQRFTIMDRKENFSYEGRKALFEHLEQYEEDSDTEIEFDCIALCCEYTEYEDLKELQNNYTDVKSMEELEDQTIVIKIDDSERFIIQDF